MTGFCLQERGAYAMATPTRTLAAFASTLSYEAIPTVVCEATKQYLFDTIGCGIYGSQTPWAKILNQLILEQGGRPEATLWLQGFRGPANMVALGLGVMMHSFELDDYHSGAKLHPGAVVIPAALAIAERQGARGREVLRAVVAGYELMIRTSLAAGTLSMRRRGWHITGLCGTFGAAAAAGQLLGLDSLQMANALGLAGTQSAGLFAFTCDGANSKRLHPGRSAQSGVFAAELAARGFTGPTAVLEYEDGGFCHAVSDASHLELLTCGLGEDYVTAGVSLKPYACCGSTHSSIDAVRWLARTHHIQPQDVDEIVVANHSVVKLQTSWWYEPVSPMQAQMNMEYLSLSRLNHWLPWGQAHPEVVQGTTEFHDQIADAFFPQADAVFDDTTPLDTTIDMLNPEPALVECLVRPLLLRRELLTTGFLGWHEELHLGQCERQEAQILQ